MKRFTTTLLAGALLSLAAEPEQPPAASGTVQSKDVMDVSDF